MVNFGPLDFIWTKQKSKATDGLGQYSVVVQLEFKLHHYPIFATLDNASSRQNPSGSLARP
jgi:hypothetical protein